MKTVSEWKEERRNNAAQIKRAWGERCAALLEGVQWDIPVYAGQHDQICLGSRDNLRARLEKADSNLAFTDVACDHCGTEILVLYQNRLTASQPPERLVGCPGCGWQGYLPA